MINKIRHFFLKRQLDFDSRREYEVIEMSLKRTQGSYYLVPAYVNVEGIIKLIRLRGFSVSTGSVHVFDTFVRLNVRRKNK